MNINSKQPMTIQKIIEKMENIVLNLVVDCRLKPMEPVRPMIRKMLPTLLESFGKEIIGEDEASKPAYEQNRGEYMLEYEKHIRDEHRDKQRLKMKEILSNLK